MISSCDQAGDGAGCACPITSKRHHNRQTKKAPVKTQNDTTDRYHSRLCVGRECDPAKLLLTSALIEAGYAHWTTNVRLSGLLALLAYVQQRSARKPPADVKLPLSNRLVRLYVSPYRKPLPGRHREALPLLVGIGWLAVAEKARVGFHEKRSARYRPGTNFPKCEIKAITYETTPCIARKVRNAVERRETALNKRFQFREQLLADLVKFTIPDSAQATVDELLNDKDYLPSTRRAVAAIKSRKHTVTVKPSSLIVTSMISCPRPLKPLLHIAGEPVSLCDISSAHWTFLPRLVADRIAFLRMRGFAEDDENSLAPLEHEFSLLVDTLSKGSFYRQFCRKDASEKDVKFKKKLLNMLLNAKCELSEKNKLWHWVRDKFPHCVGIIGTIKRENHRNISKQLQHFTAKAIEAALLDMQKQGLPAIPDTDSLIVRDCDRQAACHAIGKAMFEETRGVRVTVGGIRYGIVSP